jgi:hypothetical protein
LYSEDKTMSYLPMATAAVYGDYEGAMHLFAAYNGAYGQSSPFQSGGTSVDYSRYSTAQLKRLRKSFKRQLQTATNATMIASLKTRLNEVEKELIRRGKLSVGIDRQIGRRAASRRRGTASQVAQAQTAQQLATLQAKFKPRGTIFKFKGKDLPANVVVQPAGARRVAPRALPPNLLQLLTQALQSQTVTAADEVAAEEPAFVEATAVSVEPTLSDYLTPVNIAIGLALVGGGAYLYKTRKGKKRRR